ncbi:MAG: biopolymer transporter ExbD [Candidatus Adiutrix sp.]|jgi:biopolymer transport protein ExbD|nr:biopolymer transporter ExbD [Candidatus Adiutrix sp.]
MKLDLQLSSLDEDGLDLTPLIDVLFLLLTFFILAATFVSPALEMQLAQAQNLNPTQSDDHRLTFSIDAEGAIFYERSRIDESELTALMAAHDKDVPIIFNVDKNAPFASFMLVLDEAKSQEKHRFLINGLPKAAAAAE